MSAIQKLGLIILDGWGIGDHDKADAIFNSNSASIIYTNSF